jgi:hypothetical protein
VSDSFLSASKSRRCRSAALDPCLFGIPPNHLTNPTTLPQPRFAGPRYGGSIKRSAAGCAGVALDFSGDRHTSHTRAATQAAAATIKSHSVLLKPSSIAFRKTRPDWKISGRAKVAALQTGQAAIQNVEPDDGPALAWDKPAARAMT